MINLLSSFQYTYLKENILKNSDIFNNVNIENNIFPDGEHYWRIENPTQIQGKPAVYICGTIDDTAIFDALNKSNLYKTDINNYNLIVDKFYFNSFGLLFRADNIDAKKIISDMIIDLFYKCKNTLYIENNFPYKWMIPYIKNKQYNELFNILVKYTKEKQLIYPPQSFIKKIFSIMNVNGKKIITFLGIKIKI